MAAPTLITELSQTAGSNGPDGASTSPKELDNYQRAHASFIAQLRDGKGHAATASVASATTTDIGAVNSLSVEITGTTTITGFGTTYSGPRLIRFAGALILTNSASLALPGGANITTAAGDTCIAVPNLAASGWIVLTYQRATGLPLAGSYAASGANSDITSLSGLTTPLSIAQGGTASTTAAAAFTALKQYATETDSGVVELATNAESTTGTDSIRVPSVAGVHVSTMGNLHTWTNMAGSRSLATLYSNTSGRPIMVAVSAGSNATHHLVAQAAGTTIMQNLSAATTAPQANFVTFIVPHNTNYYVYCDAGTAYLQSWWELR